MAFHPPLTTGNQEVILSGSFAPPGAGAPTAVDGTGFTVRFGAPTGLAAGAP